MITSPLPRDPTPDAVPPASFLRGLARVAVGQYARSQPEFHASGDGDIWVQRTADILAANIASGRFQYARTFQPAGSDGEASLLSYAGQILNVVIRETERIEALLRGEGAAWQAVISRLERMAYFWLGPHGREEWASWEARDVAARTCAEIWAWLQERPYPYDVSFDRWSATILNRRLCDLVRRRQREERHYAYSLDAPHNDEPDFALHEHQLADHSLEEWLAQAANRQALIQAIGYLDTRHGLVVRLWYFDQWPADEIAAQLGTSVGNVYLLRHRAIQKLKQIVATHERLGLRETLSLLEDEARRSRPDSDLRGPATAAHDGGPVGPGEDAP
ncbi:MAG: Sigma70 r4 2 protein [Chloroflexota bacterium]|nr:Sigma70 r4 2 protein [Chloroflexota bacterium]